MKLIKCSMCPSSLSLDKRKKIKVKERQENTLVSASFSGKFSTLVYVKGYQLLTWPRAVCFNQDWGNRNKQSKFTEKGESPFVTQNQGSTFFFNNLQNNAEIKRIKFYFSLPLAIQEYTPGRTDQEAHSFLIHWLLNFLYCSWHPLGRAGPLEKLCYIMQKIKKFKPNQNQST